jgi:hypothetical protein
MLRRPWRVILGRESNAWFLPPTSFPTSFLAIFEASEQEALRRLSFFSFELIESLLQHLQPVNQPLSEPSSGVPFQPFQISFSLSLLWRFLEPYAFLQLSKACTT